MLQQLTLALHTPAISGQISVLANHAMAWDHHRHGIGGASPGHGTDRAGLSNRTCHLAVSARGAVGDLAQLLPDAALKSGGLHIRRQIQVRLVPTKVLEDLPYPLLHPVPIAMNLGTWVFLAQLSF